MQKLLLISLLLFATTAYPQIDWSNYSTSFENTERTPSLGIAIPYNGNYDNFDQNIVGISHWNAQYRLQINTGIDAQTRLFFVYDTAGVYFLLPNVTKSNAADFEFTVLLNNKTVVTPWSHPSQFTKIGIGQMQAGSGMTESYRSDFEQYLVAHLRNGQGKILSSMVVYFRKNAPEIKSVSTSDNAAAFSKLVSNEDHFSGHSPDLGWHRQYNFVAGGRDTLKLSHHENNVLISIDAKIYKKEALEYAVYKANREIRKWKSNDYNNSSILLNDLTPGSYKILIRYKRQPGSITTFHFSLSSVWYKTIAFQVALLGALVLLAALLFFLFKSRKALHASKRKAERTAGELKNIHTLLNPHFTFNALNSIQGLVNKGDVDAASTYLSSFGELLRETLKESKADLIPLKKELENINIYISLEQLRNAFTYQLDIDPEIDLFSTTIPPFILQPFVENAIKHGVAKRSGSARLNLSISRYEQTMFIKITDNGPGFNTASFMAGYGMSLSQQRIELLNDDYGEALIRLKLESNEEGTAVLLSFKNWI